MRLPAPVPPNVTVVLRHGEVLMHEPYGPADGDEGMRANIEHIKRVRASVGPDFPLMIDCYMALTVPYTIELARRIDREVPGGVKWIEEFLPPDDYDGHKAVYEAVGGTTLLTTGEHEYTRWGYRQLLERKCVDVLQPDISWVGGITEARRVVALLMKQARAPGLKRTVDPVEFRGLRYHTGVCMTIYAPGRHEELGRGGRYLCGEGEPATGLTLYPDAVLRAAPSRLARKRVFIAFGEDGADLRAQGYATVAALGEDSYPEAEAARLGCSHVLLQGRLLELSIQTQIGA
jgi:hypothetical protein